MGKNNRNPDLVCENFFLSPSSRTKWQTIQIQTSWPITGFKILAKIWGINFHYLCKHCNSTCICLKKFIPPIITTSLLFYIHFSCSYFLQETILLTSLLRILLKYKIENSLDPNELAYQAFSSGSKLFARVSIIIYTTFNQIQYWNFPYFTHFQSSFLL